MSDYFSFYKASNSMSRRPTPLIVVSMKPTEKVRLLLGDSPYVSLIRNVLDIPVFEITISRRTVSDV